MRSAPEAANFRGYRCGDLAPRGADPELCGRATRRDRIKHFIVYAGHAIRDLALIAVGWALFVAAFVYPVLHIIGLAICAVLVLRKGEARDWRSRDRVLKSMR